jgi:hypothetical protein
MVVGQAQQAPRRRAGRRTRASRNARWRRSRTSRRRRPRVTMCYGFRTRTRGQTSRISTRIASRGSAEDVVELKTSGVRRDQAGSRVRQALIGPGRMPRPSRTRDRDDRSCRSQQCVHLISWGPIGNGLGSRGQSGSKRRHPWRPVPCRVTSTRRGRKCGLTGNAVGSHLFRK